MRPSRAQVSREALDDAHAAQFTAAGVSEAARPIHWSRSAPRRVRYRPYEVTRFGDPEFSPVFEAIEEHAGRYEIVAILTDDGFGVAIFVPKQHKPVA